MIWTISMTLLIAWLLGVVGGGSIHLLLVIVVIVLIFNLLRGRRGTVF
jgi:Family of unknown function (DUF5670)